MPKYQQCRNTNAAAHFLRKDANGDYYRLIQWKDPHSRQPVRGVIPMEIIGNQWQPLQKLGIAIAANAGKGYGIYDHLHGFDNGALLSEHLEQAANRYYGSAGRAFIQAIQTRQGKRD